MRALADRDGLDVLADTDRLLLRWDLTAPHGGDHLPGRDQFECVLDVTDQRPVGCRRAIGAGVDTPERVPLGSGQPRHRLSRDVVEGD